MKVEKFFPELLVRFVTKQMSESWVKFFLRRRPRQW